MKRKEGLTTREVFEAAGFELQVDNFIRRRPHHVPDTLHLPIPEVPRNLMDPQKAEKAELLLNKGARIVGPFGEKISEKDSEEFQEVSAAFEEITGVNMWEIFSEARERLLSKVNRP